MSITRSDHCPSAAQEREQLLAEQLRQAMLMLKDAVEVSPQKRTGKPVIKGTRVSVAQILAELAEDARVSEVAEQLDVDRDSINKALQALALYLDRPLD